MVILLPIGKIEFIVTFHVNNYSSGCCNSPSVDNHTVDFLFGGLAPCASFPIGPFQDKRFGFENIGIWYLEVEGATNVDLLVIQ